MMHGRGKSSPAIVARKPANKAEPRRWLPRSRWSEGQGPRGMRTSVHAPDSVPDTRGIGAGEHTSSCKA